MLRRRAPQMVLSGQERVELEGLTPRRKTAQALAQRARIVLACAEGHESTEVAGQLRVAASTVGKWRQRLAAYRLEGLYDEPRSARARSTTPGSRR